MMNTRFKIKKTQHTLITCQSQASTEDCDDQSSHSAALIGSNDDLLTEIVVRLPITSILRFKSVCKHWQWLLSHRRFTILYDNLLKSPGIFVRNMYIPFDVEDQSPPPFRSLDFCFDTQGIAILQSCNGLLLCSRYRSMIRDHIYYVFNPTTKQLEIIPSILGGQEVGKTIYFMGLAFHQTDCVHYKLVCIRSLNRNLEYEIQMYSSETRKWKISIESFFDDWRFHHGSYWNFYHGVYWNGAMHWTPSCRGPLYFNIKDEQFQKLPMPKEVVSSGGHYDGGLPLYFGESRGHLHLVEIHDYKIHPVLNVYEMLMDHSGWFVKYQIELDEVSRVFPGTIYQVSPYCQEFFVRDVVRGEIEEDTFMVARIPGKMIRYNFHDKSIKHIFDLPDHEYECVGYTVDHRYIETLTSF